MAGAAIAITVSTITASTGTAEGSGSIVSGGGPTGFIGMDGIVMADFAPNGWSG